MSTKLYGSGLVLGALMIVLGFLVYLDNEKRTTAAGLMLTAGVAIILGLIVTVGRRRARAQDERNSKEPWKR